jgi:AmiR/NasT family two-component response regulator
MTPSPDTAEARRLRVLVAEDDVLKREGIARLLTENACDVVAQADDAEELLRKGLAHRPDVVVADVRMPPAARTTAWPPRSSCAAGSPRSACSCSLSSTSKPSPWS